MGNSASQPEFEFVGSSFHGATPLATNTFVKTCVSHARDTPVVVKTTPRALVDANVISSFEALRDRLESSKRARASHVWTNQQIVDTSQAFHVVRQYFSQSLAQRITGSAPFAFSERVWVAWQLLRALDEIHAAGISHGDIKSENIMLTSWGWLHLVDFSSSYKPTFLPLDNPTSFRVYFDTTGRRRCSIAPERFAKDADTLNCGDSSSSPLRPAMDVFSAGCVLAELFSDGASVLEYSNLGRCHAAFLNAVDPLMRDLVARMVREDPTGRPTAAACLDAFLDALPNTLTVSAANAPMFASKEDFEALEVICRDWCAMTHAERVSAALNRTRELLGGADRKTGDYDTPDGEFNDTYNDIPESIEPRASLLRAESYISISDVQDVSERLTQEIHEIMHRSKKPIGLPESKSESGHLSLPEDAGAQRLPLPPPSSSSIPVRWPPLPNGISTFMAQNLTIIFAALTRPTMATTTKLLLLDRLEKLSTQAGKDLVERVILPQFVAAATERHAEKMIQHPRIQYFALTSLPAILSRSRHDESLDLRVVADFVMPALSLLPNDADVTVRSAYAVSIGGILVEGTREHGHSAVGDCNLYDNDSDLLERIRGDVERGVHDIVVDTSSLPKVALLEHLGDVACGLGPDVTRDGLLPALLTLFNARQGDVRAAMYRSLDDIAGILGDEAVPFVLPFVDRLVSGPDVASTVAGIDMLTHMIQRNFLARRDVVMIHRRVCDLVSFATVARATMGKCVLRGRILALKRAAYEFLGPEMAAAMLEAGKGVEMVGIDTPKARSNLAVNVDVVEALAEHDSPFVMPSNLACYSVDVDHESALEQLMNNTNASAIASPTLLMSPSFQKKRVETLQALGGLEQLSFSSRHARSKSSRSASSSPVKSSRKPASPPAPKGALAARIPAHDKSITGISGNIGSQSTIFVTSSKDGSCKLWDSRKLERDITFRARATFRSPRGEYGCCATSGASFLAGRSDGVLELWNVDRDKTPAESWRLADGASILDVCPALSGNTCIASTAAHTLLGVDPRLSKGVAWRALTEPSLGIPMRIGIEAGGGGQSVSMDSTTSSSTPYFVTGSSRSCLTVWDTRFMLPVATWRNPAAAPIEAVEIVDRERLGVTMGMTSSSPTSSSPTSSSSIGPVAIVSCGGEEVSGWDLATGACVLAMGRSDHLAALKSSVMDTSRPAEDAVGLARQMGALELRSLSIKRTTIRAMALVAGEDDAGCVSVLSGGSDRSISLWNPRMPHGKDILTIVSSASDVAHRDTVTALRHVRGIGIAPLLATASADGILNVWK